MLYKDMGVRPILTFPSDALSNTIFVRLIQQCHLTWKIKSSIDSIIRCNI